MPDSSTEPSLVLIEHLSRDVGGLWSLLYASELATVHLTSVPVAQSADRDDVGVALDLREAVEELEWQFPNLDFGLVALDLSNSLSGSPTHGEGSEEVLASLLQAALDLSAELIRDPGLSMSTVMMLARVVNLVASAYLRLTGHLP